MKRLLVFSILLLSSFFFYSQVEKADLKTPKTKVKREFEQSFSFGLGTSKLGAFGIKGLGFDYGLTSFIDANSASIVGSNDLLSQNKLCYNFIYSLKYINDKPISLSIDFGVLNSGCVFPISNNYPNVTHYNVFSSLLGPSINFSKNKFSFGLSIYVTNDIIGRFKRTQSLNGSPLFSQTGLFCYEDFEHIDGLRYDLYFMHFSPLIFMGYNLNDRINIDISFRKAYGFTIPNVGLGLRSWQENLILRMKYKLKK